MAQVSTNKPIQPQPVKKIFCPRCGELLLKIYPWATLNIMGEVKACGKCLNEVKKKGNVALTC